MILVFDIGTTVLKGAAVSENGEFLRLASRPMDNSLSQTAGYEADAVAWRKGLAAIAGELRAAGEPRAVVISGNGPTIVPADRKGTPLQPAMTWMDRRGIAESETISQAGRFPIDPSFSLPKALWIKNNAPDVYERTRHFLSCPESVSFWLTGRALTICPGPYLQRYFWNDELLAKVGLDAEKFPQFAPPGTIAGTVSGTAARECGLPKGLPVVAAGPDFFVTLLGTAAVSPGRACDRSGTSEGLNLCTSDYVNDSRLMCFEHIAPPHFNLSGIISTSGRALQWIRSAVGDTDDSYDGFIARAAAAKPGASGLLFLPYLTGERAPHWDTTARAAFIGLGLEHGAPELGRAVLESVGYAIRDVAETMAESGGMVEEFRITGGPSRSAVWNQIKADITGRNVLVPASPDSDLLGNLILGLRALGETDNLAETADSIVRIAEVREPDRERARIYDEMFQLYRRSYTALRPINEALAAGAGNHVESDKG